MPGALQTFEATPTLVGNKVKWTLCHTNPQPDVCGNSNATYPDISLGKGQGAYPFQFKIVNDTTGKGIKFADGALVIKKGEPFGPGKEKQIGNISGNGSDTLTFTDLNSLPNSTYPEPVVMTYGLHFVDQNGDPVTSIDPDITNGGTNMVEPPPGGGGFGPGGGHADNMLSSVNILMIGSIVVALIAGFLIGRFWR